MFRELRAKELLAVARNLTFFLIFPATSCQLLQGPVPSHLTPFSHPCSLIAPVSCILDRLTVLRFRVPLWYPYFPFIHCLPLECLPLFLLIPNSNTVCKCRAEPLQIHSSLFHVTSHHITENGYSTRLHPNSTGLSLLISMLHVWVLWLDVHKHHFYAW